AGRAADRTHHQARVADLFARHLKGVAGPVPTGSQTYTQACGGSTQQGPFAAADWDAVHPGEVRYSEAGAKTFTSGGSDAENAGALGGARYSRQGARTSTREGGIALTAAAVDPLGPQAAFPCHTVPAETDP